MKHHLVQDCLQFVVKVLFYHKLQTVLDKMKEKDVTILMGDFNAKIGSNNRGYEEVIGTHGIGGNEREW